MSDIAIDSSMSSPTIPRLAQLLTVSYIVLGVANKRLLLLSQ